MTTVMSYHTAAVVGYGMIPHDGFELSQQVYPLSLLSHTYTRTHLASSLLLGGVVLSIRPWLFLRKQHWVEGRGKHDFFLQARALKYRIRGSCTQLHNAIRIAVQSAQLVYSGRINSVRYRMIPLQYATLGIVLRPMHVVFCITQHRCELAALPPPLPRTFRHLRTTAKVWRAGVDEPAS